MKLIKGITNGIGYPSEPKLSAGLQEAGDKRVRASADSLINAAQRFDEFVTFLDYDRAREDAESKARMLAIVEEDVKTIHGRHPFASCWQIFESTHGYWAVCHDILPRSEWLDALYWSRSDYHHKAFALRLGYSTLRLSTKPGEDVFEPKLAKEFRFPLCNGYHSAVHEKIFKYSPAIGRRNPAWFVYYVLDGEAANK